MRPIKFRGKRVDNGEWVYGDLIHGQGCKSGKTYILPQCHIYPAGCSELDGWNVIPETVGQFTGLFDKNGKEIYEGDIIGRHTDGGEIVPVSIVVYADNGFSAQSLASGIDFNFRLESVIERLTVIGNIHDNHELLKTN